MLPSADGSPLSGGSDDQTRFVPRTDRIDGHTRVVPAADHLDDRTTIVPMVRRPGRLRTLLPWAAFGIVAVVVVAATTAWASTLRGSEDPLLANATPPPVVVSQMPVSSGTSITPTPVDVTPVPAATARKAVRPTLAPVVPPKPTPAVVATTTVNPTSAAPTSAKPTKAPTRTPAAIQGSTGSPCAGVFCPSPTGANNRAPAATGQGQ